MGAQRTVIPLCKLCLSCVTAKWGNTSNLLNHLRKHHPEEYGIVKSTTGTTQQQRHSTNSTEQDDNDDGQLTIEQSFSRS